MAGLLFLWKSDYLPYWEGSEAPSEGRIVEAESRWGLDIATDYDRACDINDLAGVIDVSDGSALVISIENHATTWFPSLDNEGGSLVEWGFADSETDVIKEVENCDFVDDLLISKNFSVKSSPLVLFTAAENGCEPIWERLEFDLEPGNYRVTSQDRKNGDTYIVCHRLTMEECI